jgi:hypothetical protein
LEPTEGKTYQKHEYQFTISLKQATFSFVGNKPSHAIAKYAHGQLLPVGKADAGSANPVPALADVADAVEPALESSAVKIVDTAAHDVSEFEGTAPVGWAFNHDEVYRKDKKDNAAAATVSCALKSCTDTAEDVHALRAEWGAGSEQSTSTSQSSVGVEVSFKKTLMKQGEKFNDNWLKITLFASKKSTERTGKDSIILGAPFFINLSVSWLGFVHTIHCFMQHC